MNDSSAKHAGHDSGQAQKNETTHPTSAGIHPQYDGGKYAGGVASPPTPVNIPGGGGGMGPSGDKQSSGKTIHHRSGGLNLAGTGENMSEMPRTHQAGPGVTEQFAEHPKVENLDDYAVDHQGGSGKLSTDK